MRTGQPLFSIASVVELDFSAPPWLAFSRASLPPGEAACCCPAHACYQVVLPPSASHPNVVELLFCEHHFRLSRQALQRANAVIYDRYGDPVRLVA